VMRYADETLAPADPSEAIAAGSAKSEEVFEYDDSTHTLDIFPTQVAAGKGFYAIRISDAANADAELQYRFNEGPIALLNIHLNPKGETRFFVSNETKRGAYRFVGLRIKGATSWTRVAGTVTVTN
jgi:hypothetical protein